MIAYEIDKPVLNAAYQLAVKRADHERAWAEKMRADSEGPLSETFAKDADSAAAKWIQLQNLIAELVS